LAIVTGVSSAKSSGADTLSVKRRARIGCRILASVFIERSSTLQESESPSEAYFFSSRLSGMCWPKRSTATCAKKPGPSKPFSITRSGPGAVVTPSSQFRQAYFARRISCTTADSKRSSSRVACSPISCSAAPQCWHVQASSSSS